MTALGLAPHRCGRPAPVAAHVSAAGWLAVSFVLVPWAWLKYVILAGGVTAAGWRAGQGGAVPRSQVALGLTAVAWIVGVINCYWMLAPTWPLRVVSLVLVVGVALTWPWLLATRLRWHRVPLPWWTYGSVVATLALVTALGITAPIEYRGDEDFHVRRTLVGLEMLQRTPSPTLVGFLLAVCVLGLVVFSPLRRLAIGLVAAAPFGLLVLFVRHPPSMPLLQMMILRYPIGSTWIHFGAAFSPLQLFPGLAWTIYDEVLYRLVPMGATAVLGVWLLRTLRGRPFERVLGALVLTTVPVVAYYSTVLYVELPVVVLLTMGLYEVNGALVRIVETGGFADRKGSTLAITLALMLKETTVPIGAAVVAYYAAWATWAAARGVRARGLIRLGRIALGMLTPLGLYLFWRKAVPGIPRAWQFDPSPLGNVELYRIAAAAWIQQFGPVLLIALVGLVAGAVRRPSRVGLWLAVAAAVFLFFAGDTVRSTSRGPLPMFWGYSRFFLLFFPIVCCLSIEGFRWLVRRSRAALVAAATLLLAWQAHARPLDIDGSRVPFWGDYVMASTAGERYPYDAFYRWLEATDTVRNVVVLGRDFVYADDFYIKKYSLSLAVGPGARMSPRPLLVDPVAPGPPRLAEILDVLQREADRSRADCIVVQVDADIDSGTLPQQIASYRLARQFRLGREVLRAYVRG